MAAAHINNVEGPNRQSFQQLELEDGSERSAIAETSEAPGTGTEAPSSSPTGAEIAAGIGCVISSIMIIGIIYLFAKRKESNDGKEEQG